MNSGYPLEHLTFGPDATRVEGLAIVLVERGELRSYLESGEPERRCDGDLLALALALEALARDPREGLTLSQLAARIGLSERQASRLVQERLGSSLGEHVTQLRIARAKRMLAESDLAVIGVAAEAGFGSLGHFNHVFLSRSGITPSAFRSAMRGSAESVCAAAAQPPGSART